ncbi:MAG: hypothetical protein ACRC92_23660 [Peptostreptococcaceae bacterium]
MNKRRTIYKGFNKRRKRNELKVIAVALSICLIGGYGYIKLKDNKFFTSISDKFSSFNIVAKIENLIPGKNKVEEFSYDDVSKEVDKIKEETESETLKEDVKLAQIDGWDMYTVQVASVQDSNDLNKIEAVLKENKVPYSVVQIDDVKKIQTHGTFDKENARIYLEDIRKLYPDAFLSQVKVPMLSLEYTSKYSYVNDISTELNNLIANFQEESKFWTDSKENIDLSAYNNILTNRKEIVKNLNTQANKIDYSEMSLFKDNLINYTKDISSKIEESSKAANEQSYHLSQGLFLSCMQGYLEFINSMKQA